VADEKPKRTRKKTDQTTKPTARKAPARKAAATPRTRRAARKTISHEQIASRAYQLHLEGNGDAFANWMRAAAELTAR
jgi:hypothetical protein